MFSRIVTSSLARRSTAKIAATTRQQLQQQQILCCLSTASSGPPQAHLIINAVGKDRLGIVSDISKQVTDMGGNVGESQATKLGSYFSLMMQIDIPADQKSGLEKELLNLKDMTTAIFETEGDPENEYTPKVACKCSRQRKSFSLDGCVI